MRRRQIASKDKGVMGGAFRNPRRRPRRGRKPRLKDGFPKVSADPWSNGAGIAARGAPGIMCTVPNRFERANLPRGPTTGGGAPARGQRVPMTGDAFQMEIFFQQARFQKIFQGTNDKSSFERRLSGTFWNALHPDSRKRLNLAHQIKSFHRFQCAGARQTREKYR